MQIVFFVLLFILGACFGSFLCCQARRLHLRETHHQSLGSRSVCLSCKHQLKWYDNIPIVSWLTLLGKCRHCRSEIGIAEFLAEVGVALAFVLVGTTIDPLTANLMGWIIFIIFLIFTLVLSFLAIYDGLYGELPVSFLIIAVAIAVILLAIQEWAAFSALGFNPKLIWYPIVSVLILGGLYLILYLISKGKWVGDGDWILGTAIGLALFDTWLSLIALTIANFVACVVMLPSVKKKKSRNSKKIYFGPFMVAAFVITLALADFFSTML